MGRRPVAGTSTIHYFPPGPSTSASNTTVTFRNEFLSFTIYDYYKINNFSRAMSSTIWAGPGKSTSRHSSPDSAIVDPKQTDKYLLQVTAGSSYDQSTHKVVNVNSDEAIFVENDLMACWIKVRIRDYHGKYHSASQRTQPDRERLESCDS